MKRVAIIGTAGRKRMPERRHGAIIAVGGRPRIIKSEWITCCECGNRASLQSLTSRQRKKSEYSPRKCRSCTGAQGIIKRRERARRELNEILARGTKKCARCKNHHPLGKFRTMGPKTARRPGSYCLPCDQARVNEYRETESYTAWLKATRKRRSEYNKTWAAKNHGRIAAMYARYEARQPRSSRLAAARASAALHRAQRSGKITKPDRCEVCSRHKDETNALDYQKIRAHWPHGPSKPLDVTWLCYSHFYAAVRGVVARIAATTTASSTMPTDVSSESIATLLEALEVPSREFQAIAAQNKRAAATEFVAPDVKFTASKEEYLSRFRRMRVPAQMRPLRSELQLALAITGDRVAYDPDWEPDCE